MNKSSTEILSSIGLPLTENIPLNTLFTKKERLANQLYYIRYSTESNISIELKSTVVTADYIIDNIELLKKQYDSGYLVSIEKKYTTLFGGATLLKKGYTYTELNLGHSITLLRRGLCGARILTNDSGDVFSKKIFQGWKAKQSNIYEYFPCKGVDNSVIRLIAHKLVSLNIYNYNGVLIEWMYTKESGFLCCDAKYNNYYDFGNNLWNLTQKNEVIEVFKHPNYSTQTNIIVDQFDCDFRDIKNFDESITIHAINGSLLSHFITKAILYNCQVLISQNKLSLIDLK